MFIFFGGEWFFYLIMKNILKQKSTNNNSQLLIKMVFCKLSKEVATKLNTAEKAIENGATTTKDAINAHISKHLAAIDKKKLGVYSRLQQQKRHIQETIIQPHEERRRTNMAMMFYVDLSLAVVVSMFLYKMYPWLRRLYAGAANYTPEQYAEAMKLTESAYSREELRLAQEYRKSFQDWKDFYKAEDAFNDYNVGTTEIQRGSTLREPAKFMIQYVIPYVILAYMVWFLVKYIKYVIAAIWGFFVMMYQFVAKKITCKLAEKWYIRLGTGWSRCHPKFNQYVDEWQRNYVTRPIAQERITYLKGVHGVKTQYKSKFGEQPHLTLWNRIWDWLYDWKRIYLDLPLQELYLQLIGFNPVYVVRPYQVLTDREQAYDSKTKSGKVCKCPPRKTLYRKLKTYMETHPSPRRRLKTAATRLAGTHAKVSQKANTVAATVAATVGGTASAAASAAAAASASICGEDNQKKKRKNKTLAKGIWTLFMIGTVGAVLYGLLFSSSASSVSTAIIRNEHVAAGLALYAVFFVAGGVYSFLTWFVSYIR